MENHSEFRAALDQIYVLACSNDDNVEELLYALKDFIEEKDLDHIHGYTTENCDILLKEFQNSERASTEKIKQSIENLIENIPENNDERSVIEINIRHILTNSPENSCPLYLLNRITTTLNDNLVFRPPMIPSYSSIINLMLTNVEGGDDFFESLKGQHKKNLEQKLNNLEDYMEKVEKVAGVNESAYDSKGDNFSIYIESNLDRAELKQALDGFPSETRIKEFVAADHELWKRGRNLPVFRTNLPTYQSPTLISHHAPGTEAYAKDGQHFDSEKAERKARWQREVDVQLEKRVSEFDEQLNYLFGALNIPKGPGLDAIAPYLSNHIPDWLTESKKNSGKSIIASALRQEKGESIHDYSISTDNIRQADQAFDTLVRTIEYMSDPIFALNMFGEEVTAESVLDYEFIDGNRLSKSPYVSEELQSEMVNAVIALYELNKQYNGE